MLEGCGTKLACVIKCNFCNFDEVWSKRKDERHDIYKLCMHSNFQKNNLDFHLIPKIPCVFLTLLEKSFSQKSLSMNT
jgi:hypothetical protein